jgi:pimeloyl-ACP methyl ester carboxylesterase
MTKLFQPRSIVIGPDPFSNVDQGFGPPVLFLHGALGDLRTWLPHVQALPAKFRCIAYTQRCFGTQSWRNDGPPFGVATHADDLIAFVEALSRRPVSLVAWSYAGHVALHAALQRPDLFSRLLLYEHGVRTIPLDANEQHAFTQDAEAAFGPIIEAVGQGNLKRATRLLIDASGGSGYFDALPPERRAVYLDNAHTMPLLLAQEPPPFTTCEALGRLSMPVAVLWGEHSRPISKVPSQAVARCIRPARHGEVPGVEHLWPEENPNAFCACVARWLHEAAPSTPVTDAEDGK